METAIDWYIIWWLWSRRVIRNLSGQWGANTSLGQRFSACAVT